MEPVSPAITDYTMARRAVLADLKAGRVRRDEVCDGHPDLIRAARYSGLTSGVECPVCRSDEIFSVTFAFGERLARRNGRTVSPEEIPAYLALEGVRCFTVEVCTDCSWNHLVRSYIGREAAQSSTYATGRSVETPPGE